MNPFKDFFFTAMMLAVAMFFLLVVPKANAIDLGSAFSSMELRAGDIEKAQDVQLFIKQGGGTRLATGACSGSGIEIFMGGKRAGGLLSGCGFGSAAITGSEPDFSGAIGLGADFLGIKFFVGRDPVNGEWSRGIGFSLVGGVVDALTK